MFRTLGLGFVVLGLGFGVCVFRLLLCVCGICFCVGWCCGLGFVALRRVAFGCVVSGLLCSFGVCGCGSGFLVCGFVFVVWCFGFGFSVWGLGFGFARLIYFFLVALGCVVLRSVFGVVGFGIVVAGLFFQVWFFLFVAVCFCFWMCGVAAGVCGLGFVSFFCFVVFVVFVLFGLGCFVVLYSLRCVALRWIGVCCVSRRGFSVGGLWMRSLLFSFCVCFFF